MGAQIETSCRAIELPKINNIPQTLSRMQERFPFLFGESGNVHSASQIEPLPSPDYDRVMEVLGLCEHAIEMTNDMVPFCYLCETKSCNDGISLHEAVARVRKRWPRLFLKCLIQSWLSQGKDCIVRDRRNVRPA